MMARIFRLLPTLLLLLLLLAIALGASFLPIDRSARPILLVPAVLMVMLVGTMFMEAGRGPSIVRLFIASALLWLAILLGLGSVDPLTRTDYHVQEAAD